MPSEDAKTAKLKEEEEDDENLNSILKARKKNPSNAPSKSLSKGRKLKKEDPSDDDDFDIPLAKRKSSSISTSKTPLVKKQQRSPDLYDDKPLSIKKSAVGVTNELNKKKRDKGGEKKGSGVIEQNGKKKEKKVYDLPGQKRDPPEERDPLRIFYESLYEQIPKSEMAQIWMMESGLLLKEEAKKVYEKKQVKKNQQKLSSLTATKKTESAAVKKKTPSSSVTKKTADSNVKPKPPSRKRKTSDGSSGEDSDDDFIFNRSTKKQRAS